MWFVILLAVLAALIYFNFVKPLKHWEKKRVPHMKPWPFFGNMAPSAFRTRSLSHLIEDFYKAHPDKRYMGFYQFLQPTLLIRDLELIKKITVKEFDSFPDHRSFSNPSDPLWSRNIFALSTKNGWQDMRATLSPSFTSSKMKSMFILMQQCATQFTKHFQSQQGTVEVEMRDAFTRFTNDVIGTTAFGVTCDSLENRNNEFYLMGKDASDFTAKRALIFFGYAISPLLMRFLNVTVFSKKVSVFFRQLIKDTLKLREEKQIVRPDVIHLLMEARKGRLKDDEEVVPDAGFATVQESNWGKSQKRQKLEITDDDITAQALVFFLGGFDTTSILMCNLAYLLAVHPDVQSRLREEVDATVEACKAQMTYEALMGMKYLDCVVSETLRFQPVAPLLDRICMKPFTIEPELPGEEPVYIEAGTLVWVPAYPIHRDPNYYLDPDKFDPERFSDENKHQINPLAYMPFGAGPRNCIGSRFALLENKLIIVELLRKFEIVPTKKTQIPFILSKKNFNPVTDAGYWLGLKPRAMSK